MAASRALYEAMAQEIKGHKDQTVASLVKDLIPILKADNRAFKADKFIAACGLTDEIPSQGY